MTDSKASLDSLRIDRRTSLEPGRRRTRFVVLLLLLLAVGAGVFVMFRRPGISVRTHTLVGATSEGGRTVLNASGYVVARREATVSSKVTGKVTEVLIEEGMQVQEGQVLARLDDTNARASLRLAEARHAAAQAALAETRSQLDQARKEFHRIRELRRVEISSEADLDRAETEVRVQEARLVRQEADAVVAERDVEVWRQQLEDNVIRAPFAGMATAKNAQPGEMISPISAGGGFTRTGIGTIVDMSSLEIEVEVNESFLNRVKPGQRVEAALDAYPDWKIPARVLAIIPTADRQKATVKVRVQFDALDPRMLPQMGVKVAFLGDAADVKAGVVSLPKTALRKADGKPYAIVIEDGVAKHRNVTIGLQRTDTVEISAGLNAGERVVVEGPANLRDGARVTESPR